MSPQLKSIIRAIQSEALHNCATRGGTQGVRFDRWMHTGGAMPNSLDAPDWIAAGSTEATHTLVCPRITAIERGAA